MSKTRQVLGKVLPVFRNEFNSLTQYEQLDIVTYEGSTYIAKQDTQGNLPTNTTYFALLVQKPIKGTDYFTQEEIDDIVDEVIEDATNTFNQNVVTKTNEFNTNATNKTDTFNSNATSKTSDFNSNYDSKLSSFDSHVSDKKDELDTYEESKETAFDSHVSDKIDEFDSNATSKTTAFNTNATSKTNDFNSNASAKTTEFNNNVGNIERELDKYKTIYNVLPKTSNETISSEVELSGTGEAYMKVKPYGKVSQESTSISGGDEYDSPSPDHPQPIRYVTGDNEIMIFNKNFFDVNNFTQVDPNDRLGFDISKLEIGKQYTLSSRKKLTNFKISTNSAGYNSVQEYDASGFTNFTFIMTRHPNISEDRTQYAFLTGFDDGDILLNNLDVLKKYDIQLEEGSTPTSYTPHKEQNYPLNIGNLEMYEGDYFFKNTIDDENYDSNLDLNAWYLKNNWGKVVLDGSEEYSIQISDTINTISFKTTDIVYNTNVNNNILKCNRFTNYKWIDSIYTKLDSPYLSQTNVRNLVININRSELTTEDSTGFKQWLSNNNTTVFYPLETPKYTKITDTTLISQLEAINSANSYQEKTYITCTSASADNEVLQVKAVALKDIQTMFDETNNAIIEIGGE